MKRTDLDRIYRAVLGGLISSGVDYRELSSFLEELGNGKQTQIVRKLLRDVRRLEVGCAFRSSATTA